MVGVSQLALKGSVLQGSVSPNALVIDLVPSTDVPDLTVVTGASFLVVFENDTRATWACTLSLQTATTLRLTHAYASGETDAISTFRVYPVLTLPGGERRARGVTVQVVRL